MVQMVKNLPAIQETLVQPSVRKIPRRREWQPTPVFWPRKSHGQRGLAGYSPWGQKRIRQDLGTTAKTKGSTRNNEALRTQDREQEGLTSPPGLWARWKIESLSLMRAGTVTEVFVARQEL